MSKFEEQFERRLRPRAIETVSINIPKDTLESVKKVVVNPHMSVEALLKFYIGQSLPKIGCKASCF